MFHSEWLPTRANVLRTFALAFSIGLTWVSAPASAGTNTFTPVGPEGGGVNDLAWHPTDPNIVYAATNGGIYRSTDGGSHWQLAHDRMIEAPRALTVHPSQPNRVFAAGYNSGVLASTDAGATWTALVSYATMGFPAWDVKYSPDGSTLYVATTRRVIRSTDHGETWQSGSDLPPTVNMIHRMLIDAADPLHLVVTADKDGFESTDGGLTWLPQPWNMPPDDVQDFAQAGSRLWVASQGGTFFSDDHGANWHLSLNGSTMEVTVDPNDPLTVYSGSQWGLHRTTNNGANWTNLEEDFVTGSSDDAGRVNSIVIDPSDSEHLLIAGYSGIATSFDGGVNWSTGHNGIRALGASRLISVPGSDRIYVQTPYEGVFAICAADGSSTGLNNPQLRQVAGSIGGTIDTYSMLVLPDSPDRLFLGRWRGVARSLNGGTSWTAYQDPDFINELVTEVVSASDDNQRLLAVAPTVGLFESIDGGINWSRLSSLSPYFINTLVSAPSNPQTLYMIARVEIATTEFALLRSFDGGATWTHPAGPSPSLIAVAVDPTNDRTVYVSAGEGELYKSSNGGSTWTRLIVTSPHEYLPIFGIAIDPQNPNIVYAGGRERISRSVDGGQTWQTLLVDGERLGYVSSLVVDAQRPHNVYASFGGHGIEQISIEPDLQLTATSSATPVGAGATGTYSFRARNVGPFAATNVRTRVALPTDAINVSATSTNGACSIAANVVTCVAPALHLDSYVDITVNSTQPSAGNFALTASVDGDQPDTTLANNTMTSNAVITEIADISVALVAPSQVVRGEAITFSLTVSNAGPSEATTPTVSFSLASGLNIASVTPSTNCTTAGTTVTCQLATLAADASTTLSIVTAVTPAVGSYAGTATLTSTGTDPVASNDAATRSVNVVEPVAGIGGSSGGGSGSGGGSANTGSGGGGSTSPWMLLALLLLSAARPVRRPQRLGQGISGSTSRASCSSDSCQPR